MFARVTTLVAVLLAAAGATAAGAKASVAPPVLTVDAVQTSPADGGTAQVTTSVNSPWFTADCSGISTDTDWSWSGSTLQASPATLGQALDVGCYVDRDVISYTTQHNTGRVLQRGVRAVSGSIAGNCNWGTDGRGDLIATCLHGHSTAHYTLTLPRHRRFTSITHHVSNGMVRCHGSWSVAHRRGTRTWHASFASGNRSGWSQCVISNVALQYHWSKRIKQYDTVEKWVSGTGIVR